VAPSVPLERGDVAVFDRAYSSFAWYTSLDDKGVFFVTRQKSNAHYSVTERRDTSGHENILCDNRAVRQFVAVYVTELQVHRLNPMTGEAEITAETCVDNRRDPRCFACPH